MSGHEWRSRPCELAPDMWFSTDPLERGKAVHMCRRHCLRLEECDATEERPVDGVLAGVLYNANGKPGRQPGEVVCGGCVVPPANRFAAPRPAPCEMPATWGAIKRHKKQGERLCHPCAVFASVRRSERRRRAAA